ncbi:hypothetical protein PLESTB_000516900 [Pleodorina starrii]|uniref:Cyclin C-terminal domain-containing protein n=1 Tax=Pleodorina starrii TaxID=330485 RepID=A0A9W6BG67_9CHLO|nr:hypothetical protein PLESTB_000516900 [Pleodorina starrii]
MALHAFLSFQQNYKRAFEIFCHRSCPQVASVAAEAIEGSVAPVAYWRDVVRYAGLLSAASAATTDPARSFNRHFNPGQRAILTEWLIQVSHAWNLESPTVFLAVRVLDAYLASEPLTCLNRLQLVGCCALRVAMLMHERGDGDFASRWQRRRQQRQRQRGRTADADAAVAANAGGGHADEVSSGLAAATVWSDVHFPASKFAYVCQSIYDVASIELTTDAVGDFVASQLGHSRPMMAPTARHFLRGLLPAAAAAVAPAAALGAVLYLAGFLLHLSLLDATCCTAPPPHAAAAAMSLALEALGLPRWPPALRRALPLRLAEDLEPLRQRIAAAQLQRELPYLRSSWMKELSKRDWNLSCVTWELSGMRSGGGVADGDGAGGGVADGAAEVELYGDDAVGMEGAGGGGAAAAVAAAGGGDAGTGAGALGEESAGGGGGGSVGGGGGSVGGGDAAVEAMRRRVEALVAGKGPLLSGCVGVQ